MSEAKKILIVEDDPTAIHLLTNILQKAGYQVEVATDGYAGLSKLRECSPQVVLCDIVMPRLDGFAFCREVRKIDTQVTIIIISSSVEVKDLLSVLGAQASIPKPVNHELLLDTIKNIIGPGQAVSEEPAVFSSPPPSDQQKNIGFGKRVLIVDDEESIGESFQRVLERLGFQVTIAANGQEGLKAVAVQKIDLIITDVLMPVMDGYTFCKELKKSKEFSNIPIVIISGRRKMEEAFMGLGINSFLSKPFSPEEILVKVSALTMAYAPVQPVVASDQTVAAVAQRTVERAVSKRQEVPVQKSAPPPAASAKKILLYGDDAAVLEDIQKKLQEAGGAVTLEKDGRQTAAKTDLVNPDLILVQLYFNEENPVDQTVAEINGVIRKKIREHEAKFKGKTAILEFKAPPVVLYKVPEEVTASGTTGENLVLMEDLLARCREQGIAKYIGMYSPMSFLTKVKEFIV